MHVFVANGSGESGAAAKAGQVLAGKQYPTPGTGNAPTTATTTVFYTPGHDAQAQLVAKSLDLPVTAVAPMPNPPPGQRHRWSHRPGGHRHRRRAGGRRARQPDDHGVVDHHHDDLTA